MTTPNPPDATWMLPTKHLGQRALIFDSLDSTNTMALALADDPSRHGLAILARRQTAGRGQYGRTWQAPPDSSVLLSLLLFPPPHLRRPALLTAWASVSVCETILEIANLQAKIRWPNDVLIQGKKVCGILIEQRTLARDDFPLATVVGIGLNVSQSAEMFAHAGLPDAVSLGSAAGRDMDFEDAARNLIHQLDAHYAGLVDGDWHTLDSLWKWRLGLLGKLVAVEGVHQLYRGRLLDATLDGIDLDVDGTLLRLAPDVIRHIHE
ncbi:MAG: biotin--[acetyl-CoA-carboxylase] ligase [Planctomycetes bacterium]|nr:biotin--[acetyl-CoA-carboxylase] ligase [Planctomycetota bacterium]